MNEDTEMITTEQQRKELENLARPMIEWLAENFDPHAKLIIDSTSAELLGGSCAFRTDDYIKDWAVITIKFRRNNLKI